jgi:hypothetical protein
MGPSFHDGLIPITCGLPTCNRNESRQVTRLPGLSGISGQKSAGHLTDARSYRYDEVMINHTHAGCSKSVRPSGEAVIELPSPIRRLMCILQLQYRVLPTHLCSVCLYCHANNNRAGAGILPVLSRRGHYWERIPNKLHLEGVSHAHNDARIQSNPNIVPIRFPSRGTCESKPVGLVSQVPRERRYRKSSVLYWDQQGFHLCLGQGGITLV